MTCINDDLKTHPFERTLGPAPYRVVGFFALMLPSEANQGRNNFHLAPHVERGMGTCAHCGTAIVNVYIIECGNRLKYGVGSDCIHKVNMDAKEISKLERMERQRQKLQRANRKAAKGDAARKTLGELIASDGQKMSLIAHPSRPNATLLDYAEWVLEYSSDGGIVFTLKRIQDAINGKD